MFQMHKSGQTAGRHSLRITRWGMQRNKLDQDLF